MLRENPANKKIQVLDRESRGHLKVTAHTQKRFLSGVREVAEGQVGERGKKRSLSTLSPGQ